MPKPGETTNKDCRTCFHRSITDTKEEKDYSYCNIKNKIMRRIKGIVCKHYKEENIWKE